MRSRPARGGTPSESLRDRPHRKRTGHSLSTGGQLDRRKRGFRRHVQGMNIAALLLLLPTSLAPPPATAPTALTPQSAAPPITPGAPVAAAWPLAPRPP